jgi:hypothetical protein
VAAAVPTGFDLDEIVPDKKAELLTPGHAPPHICHKILRAWPYHRYFLFNVSWRL